MKKLLALVAASFSFQAANAGNGWLTGTVSTLDAPSSMYGTNVGYVLLTGVTAAGSCLAAPGSTLILFRLKDDDQGKFEKTVLLSAKALGSTVSVFYDDSSKDAGGYCWLRDLQ